MILRNHQLAFLIVLILSAGGDLARTQTKTTPPVKLPPNQRRQVSRLVSQFRRARNDLQQRARIAEQAARLGVPAVAALDAVIAREIYPKLESYRSKFYQQATIVGKKNLEQVNLPEVVLLRQTVLALQQAADFSKETIIQRGDPAVKRLAELLLVRREEVLRRSKALQAERLKLQGLGLLWQQGSVYLYRLMPKGKDQSKEPFNFEKYLQGEEDLAAGLAAPMDTRTRQILLANGRLAGALDPEEARGILALNLTRNLLGLAPLMIDPNLCAAARGHSKDMRTLKFFAHRSPVPGKQTPSDRAQQFGTTASAENIYCGVPDGKAANLAWFHSPGHHKNMLGKYTRVGLGRSGAYFTELFGR